MFRIPLDGAAPSALKTAGSPIDQFSFLESDDGFLNVLLRGSGRGDAMFNAERGGMQLALMRVPLSSDGCVAFCVDWYGNSRPIFLRNRVFALMGYEIVEGNVANGRISETRRINFAPHWLSTIGRR